MLFNRVATLVVGPKSGGAGREISNMRIAFEVEKDTTPTPNIARVTVSNLSEQTRSLIREHYSRIILSVGYATEDQIVIFSGDVDNVNHKKEPPDVTTLISSGDGRTATRDSRLSISLEPGCTIGQACKVVADRMALSLDDFLGSEAQMSGGYAFVGPGETALRQLTNTAGGEYSIQDGRLQLLKRGALRPGTGFLVSPQTGLIGSPERVVNQKGNLDKNVPRVQWNLRSLLNPRLQPAQRLEIQSSEVNGVFRIDKLKHTGDTHGDDWFTELQVSAP